LSLRYIIILINGSEKNDKNILPDEVIRNRIFFVRAEKVMLDRDLAVLFDVKAIRIREQVRRNSDPGKL
jgi:hypothetical protein